MINTTAAGGTPVCGQVATTSASVPVAGFRALARILTAIVLTVAVGLLSACAGTASTRRHTHVTTAAKRHSHPSLATKRHTRGTVVAKHYLPGQPTYRQEPIKKSHCTTKKIVSSSRRRGSRPPLAR